jgi:hypothetical protein
MLGLGLVVVSVVGPDASGTPPSFQTLPPIDFPNPQGPRASIDLRTWTQSTPLNLIGKDQFFGEVSPTFDWPNPRGYAQPIDNKTWAFGTPINLIGKDQFFGVGGPKYDYPNPRGYRQPIDNLTLTNFGPSLLHFTPTFGLGGTPNFDFPNPRGAQRAINLLTITNPLPLPLVTFPGFPCLVYSVDQGAVSVYASDSPSGQGWKGAGYMAKYEIDTSIQINGDFLNAIDDIYVDPSGVFLFILDPSGFQTSFQYTGVPASPITRDSQGHYHFVITPSKSGTWTYKWQATGTFIGTSPDTFFTVNASALLAG